MPSLRWIIRRQQVARETVERAFTIPGEPIIYSIKYNVDNRREPMNYFRREAHKTMLKCVFPSYFSPRTPVVVIVRFYVTPPAVDPVKHKDLKGERKPATRAYETCDYLLAFLEILRSILFNTYRQIVKIDAEKYYSDNPRTVFQYMSWEHYGKLKTGDPLYTETKEISKSKPKHKNLVRTEQPAVTEDPTVPCEQVPGAIPDGSSASSGSSFAASTVSFQVPPKKRETPITSHGQTRRRQPREAPE